MPGQKLPQALYQQVKLYVTNQIESGQWLPGMLIPSEHQLVEQFKISRMTVNRALRELAQEQIINRVAGVGTFVADRKPQSSLLMIANIGDEIRARNHRYRCEVIKLSRESASFEIAAALSISTGQSVYHIICIHYEEDMPVQLENRFVNPAVASNFIEQNFSEELTPSQYLLGQLPVDEMEHIVDATMPEQEQAKVLQIEQNEPCLMLMRRTWAHNQIVTYVRFLHPSSRYRLGGRMHVSPTHSAG
ncbi:histidine utilization repressor [Celerinatantimonas diazotrophica]|uniref:Histidine utilization repressor n=1 Tax=Celerinatantimonas diazotrophica TaxID=412034 RepID=A0A4R1J925_9GAMM|nr:histidine utilization repressor [Celerinatantimonas diazotrophica]TCK47113.1 GntR family transcriptional regulator [Celerinatantimonas diazotrophica]CAG9295884.1 HTH-type transcriptional repressor NagR [Celerinatantimonas diazotrophica]